MAFGKKKGSDDAAAEAAVREPAVDEPAVDGPAVDGPAPVNLFDEDPADDDVDQPAETASDGAQAASGAEAAQAPAGEPATSPDALLALFQDAEEGGSDRSTLIELAGEVELSDLLDDLRTLAVALRIAPAAP